MQMKAKRFAHFLSHWYQLAAVSENRATPASSPRVKAAKAALRSCLGSGRTARATRLARV
jgi:hypothetical protein